MRVKGAVEAQDGPSASCGCVAGLLALLRPSLVRRLLSPWRGVRVGEARHPGPPSAPRTAKLVVANVTSWRASWKGLLAAGADAWFVQEARIPSGEMEAAAAGALQRGMRMHPGPHAEEEHLLAAASRVGSCVVRTERP